MKIAKFSALMLAATGLMPLSAQDLTAGLPSLETFTPVSADDIEFTAGLVWVEEDKTSLGIILTRKDDGMLYEGNTKQLTAVNELGHEFLADISYSFQPGRFLILVRFDKKPSGKVLTLKGELEIGTSVEYSTKTIEFSTEPQMVTWDGHMVAAKLVDDTRLEISDNLPRCGTEFNVSDASGKKMRFIDVLYGRAGTGAEYETAENEQGMMRQVYIYASSIAGGKLEVRSPQPARLTTIPINLSVSAGGVYTEPKGEVKPFPAVVAPVEGEAQIHLRRYSRLTPAFVFNNYNECNFVASFTPPTGYEKMWFGLKQPFTCSSTDGFTTEVIIQKADYAQSRDGAGSELLATFETRTLPEGTDIRLHGTMEAYAVKGSLEYASPALTEGEVELEIAELGFKINIRKFTGDNPYSEVRVVAARDPRIINMTLSTPEGEVVAESGPCFNHYQAEKTGWLAYPKGEFPELIFKVEMAEETKAVTIPVDFRVNIGDKAE